MMTQAEIIATLQGTNLFNGLNSEQYTRLANLAQTISLSTGQKFIEEGKPSDQFYLIKDGSVNITKQDSSRTEDHHIATLNPGDIVGEIGLISGRNRDATASAATTVTLISFPIEQFRREENHDLFLLLSKNLTAILANRLEYAYNVTVESMRSTLKQSKRIVIYQSVVLIVLLMIVVQFGASIYYLYHTDDFCKLRYGSSQKGPDTGRGFGGF